MPLINGGKERESISIRVATNEDAPEIASVLRESFLEFRHLYTVPAFAATILGANRVRKRIFDGSVWVALVGEEVAGTVSSADWSENTLYIRSMAVLPRSRRAGVAWALLAHMEAIANSKGSRRLLLSTTPFLNGAIRLYERFGFQRTDEGPHHLFGTPLFTMEKRLGRTDPESHNLTSGSLAHSQPRKMILVQSVHST